MRRFLTGLLPCLLPASALAGAQYSAEDVIRYFQQANAAATAPGPSVARTAPTPMRGIVVGDPGSPALTGAAGASGATEGGAAGGGVAVGGAKGVVIGNAPRPALTGVAGAKAALPAATAQGDPPLAIPMTGAKAGHGITEAAVSRVAVTATAAADASPDAPAADPPAGPSGGYDMLVTFELDSATLTPQARQNLDTFARALTSPALAALRFAVEGHTDATGSAEHNLALSQRRAASVVAYLVENGVAADRLIGAGFGETRPRVADPEHAGNRRVETRRLD